MTTLDISSKEAYLAWVMEWKKEWHETVAASKEAKALKKFHRDSARDLRARKDESPTDPSFGCRYDQVQYHTKEMVSADWRRLLLKWKARRLQAQRMEGKRLSYEAKKQSTVGA